MAQDANQASVNWLEYFQSISKECPWSLAAYKAGQLDIVAWTGTVEPLGNNQARMYTVNLSNKELAELAESLDEGDCEWLYSYPGYGPYATPVSVLIQQDRATLTRLRKALGE